MPSLPRLSLTTNQAVIPRSPLLFLVLHLFLFILLLFHRKNQNLTTSTAILEGQIKNIATIKPIIDTSGTITLNTETGFFSRLFQDTAMSVYFEMAFVAIVGVLFYVLYVKDQEDKLLSNMAVAQAREIGSLRLHLRKSPLPSNHHTFVPPHLHPPSPSEYPY